jgi:hypothetical protein
MTAMTIMPVVTPSLGRLSDWSYDAPIKSVPPFFKAAQMTAMYETIRLLGRGSFGDVNLAKDCSSNRCVTGRFAGIWGSRVGMA